MRQSGSAGDGGRSRRSRSRSNGAAKRGCKGGGKNRCKGQDKGKMKGKNIDNSDLQQFYDYFESRMNIAFDRIDEMAQNVEATVQANTTAVNHNSRAVTQNARAVNHNSAAVRALINFLAEKNLWRS